MTPLMIAIFVSGGVCLAIGSLELAVATRVREPGTHLAFGMTALAAAANAFVEPLAYRAQDQAAFSSAMKLQVGVQIVWWALLTWYLVRYMDRARRWLAASVFAGLGISAVVHVASPHGLLFSEVHDLIRLDLPWGETIALGAGPPNPLRWVGDLTILLLIALAIDIVVGLARAGERQRAWLLGTGLAALMAALVHGTLVDLQILGSPYLISFAFLLLVLLTAYDLVTEVVRASELSREAADAERQLRLLTDSLPALIGYVDRKERFGFANAAFTTWFGQSPDAVHGRTVREVMGEEVYLGSQEHLRTAFSGSPVVFQSRIAQGNGPPRIVAIDLVPHVGEVGVEGVYLLANDLTDRHEAQQERDRAMEELEALKSRLEEENIYLKQEIQVDRGFSAIVGDSKALRYVLHRIEQVAPTDATVLIEGETGVGKELVARAIHQASDRSGRPFLKVDCAALPPALIEAELFGHENGAFTGATAVRMGRFEVADGGTLFLDEVGEIPPGLQSKLLRALEDGDLERVGSSRPIRVDVRVIAATNRDIQAEIADGRFREDLFYRLNVYPITVPPLRQRREDIRQLVNHFVKHSCARLGKTIDEIPATLMRQLEEYDWPGNVRELRNLIERAVILAPGPVLGLPEALGSGGAGRARSSAAGRTMEEVEREHILAVLDETDGQVAGRGGAAEVLGLAPSTLRSRMKKLGIRVERQAAAWAGSQTRHSVGDNGR